MAKQGGSFEGKLDWTIVKRIIAQQSSVTEISVITWAILDPKLTIADLGDFEH